MTKRAPTYDDVLGVCTRPFEDAVASAETVIAKAGGRFLSRRTLESCMSAAIVGIVERAPDAALLGIVASRPDLLHAEPKLYGPLPTARGALEHALKESLSTDLKETALARNGEGQDAETMPEVAEAALKALAELEATGVRFQHAKDVRQVFAAGDWESVLVYGVGIPLVEFLDAKGRNGVANDLKAAIEARHDVMARPGGLTLG